MSRSLWNWILEIKDDEELQILAKEVTIKIDGFRKIDEKLQMKMLRPLIIKALVKKEKNLKTYYKKKLDSVLTNQLDIMEEDDIKKYILESKQPEEIFIALLVADKSEYLELAEKYFKEFSDNGQIDKWAQQLAIKREFLSVIKTLKKKNVEYQTRIEELNKEKNSFEEKQKEYVKCKKIIKEYQIQIEDLTVGKKNMTNELQKLQIEYTNEKNNWNLEKENLLNELIQLKDTLNRQELSKHDKKNELAEPHDNLKKSKVALISKKIKLSVKDDKTEKYEISKISIDTLANYKEIYFDEFEEVWLLMYDIPTIIQRNMKKVVNENKIKQFYTFDELSNYIQGA